MNKGPNDFDAAYTDWQNRCDRVRDLDKLFVVGCAKSGTTWLQKLLDGHPELHVGGEGRYFWSLAQGMQKVFEAFNASLPAQGPTYAPWWPNDEFVFVLRTTIEAGLARSLAVAQPAKRLRMVGDKTPMHTLAVGALSQLFPNAKFIHIIRDPRDATISQWLFWAKDNDPRPFEAFVEYSITKVWPLNVQSARNAGQALGDRYAEVRYEDLIDDTRGELTRLVRFLGLDDTEHAIDAGLEAGRFSAHAGGREQGTEGGDGQLFRKGVAGDWVNHIPADLAQRCCEQIAPLMRSCGYEPAQPAVAG